MGHQVSVFLENSQLRPLWKYMLHLYTGRSEIARICAGSDPKQEAQHNAAMGMKCAKSLKLSVQLAELTKPVFALQVFSVLPLKNAIIEKKGLLKDKARLVVPNVTHSLQSLRLVNVVYQQLLTSKNATFRYDHVEHVDLLESLWHFLKPGVVRSNHRHSKEWGELGFQGTDPATDFRGMGLLGLEQLVYFAKHYPTQAIHLLDLSNDPNIAYFPFAATAINITAFVLQLFQEHRLHGYLLEREDQILLLDGSMSPEGASEDATCVAKGLDYIHDLYCELYTDFGRTWKAKQPKDLMDFPPIFAELKAQWMAKYPAL